MQHTSTRSQRKVSTSETLAARRVQRKLRELERETLRRDAELRLALVKEGK